MAESRHFKAEELDIKAVVIQEAEKVGEVEVGVEEADGIDQWAISLRLWLS